MSPADELDQLMDCFDKTLELLNDVSSDYYDSDFAEMICAEASFALFILADIRAFSYGYDRVAVNKEMYDEIAKRYKGYFVNTYVDAKRFSDVFVEHVDLYADAVQLKYTPPCAYSMHKRLLGDSNLAAVFDVLGDYIYYPMLSGRTFDRDAPSIMVSALDAVQFHQFYCESIIPIITAFVQAFDNIFPLQHRNENTPTPSKASFMANVKTDLGNMSPVALLIVILAVIVCIIGILNVVFSPDENTEPYEIQESTSPPVLQTPIAPPPVPIGNGQLLKSTGYECLCPFSVSVSGDDGYYIYLEYQYSPSYSSETRKIATGDQPDIAFYVAPDSTVEIDVPIGVYKLYYAYGATWYGIDELFGEDTICCTSSELLEFYADTQYYNGVTLELWPQYNGNFSTTIIDESSLP